MSHIPLRDDLGLGAGMLVVATIVNAKTGQVTQKPRPALIVQRFSEWCRVAGFTTLHRYADRRPRTPMPPMPWADSRPSYLWAPRLYDIPDHQVTGVICPAPLELFDAVQRAIPHQIHAGWPAAVHALNQEYGWAA